MPNSRVVEAEQIARSRRPCGIIRVAALWPLCRYRHNCHWSGHRTRLDRTFGKKFGDKAYAMEEMVAELGAAMICGDLGLPTEMHDTHASYLASWLKVLKADKTAIFLAASKAEQAFSYLRAFSTAAADAPQARLAG